MRPIAVLLSLLSLASTAFASDGALEINQTCAVQTGCFRGDDPGFPVTIPAAGSYVLTSNLIVPDENAHAIRVHVDDVGIDLNDFVIQGPVECGGVPIVCSPSPGDGVGILASPIIRAGISVRNGSIRGMGRTGIALGPRAVVSNVRAYSNGYNGIRVGTGANVTGNTAYSNALEGITLDSGSVASGNVSYQNGRNGIAGNAGVNILGNSVYQNGGDGISCNGGCLVRDNVARLNAGFGLSLGSPESAYGANVVVTNAGGTVSGGTSIQLNLCDGASAPACP